MSDHSTILTRIYRLKLIIVGVLLVLTGLALSLLADWLASSAQAPHLVVAALGSLSDVLLVTGAIGIAVDFFIGRDKEAADVERTRSVLKELTPEFTDATLRAFASSPEDLRRVATPELLDAIATNALSLRLGDNQFAREIYADVRDQSIKAAERWHNVEVGIRLSTTEEGGAKDAPLLDVLVEWQYTTVPSHRVRRFAATSDQTEYDELATETPATSTWFMTPAPGLDATKQDSFELLYFGVDGRELPIRRTERKTGQTYSVNVNEAVAPAGKAVRIRHLYRTRLRQTGHFLFIELPQPAKNLSLKLDYTATSISRLRVLDLVSSSSRPDVMRLPKQVNARELSVDLPGWLLPRAGFTFVWSLTSEESGSNAAGDPAAALPVHADRRSA